MKHIFTLTCLMALLNFCSRSHYINGNIESGDNDKPEGSVKAYEYSYSGTMAYPINYYTLKILDDGTVQLGYSHDDDDIHLVKVSQEALKKIEQIAEEYSLHKLKRSYRPRMEVYDGYGWHVYIDYEKGGIASGGTNAWPKKKLSDGISCINSYLDSLFRAATPQDSLGIAHHHDW